MPFAILRYDPHDEWQLRRETRLLATRLGETGSDVHTIQMSDLLWESIGRAKDSMPSSNWSGSGDTSKLKVGGLRRGQA